MVLNAELLGLDMREMLDVAYVRRRKNAAHMSDEDALTLSPTDAEFSMWIYTVETWMPLWLSINSKPIFTLKTFCPVPTPR